MLRRRLLPATLIALTLGGCASSNRVVEPPPILPLDAAVSPDNNPAFIPLGPRQYGLVFETCLKVLNDYGFEILESNRYDGRIECRPRVAPGLILLTKPGSPDLRERLLATTQSYRHRVSLAIQPADNTGFFIQVTARKELEDLPKPVRGTVGGAVFRTENSLERQYEVIDPVFFEPAWIYKGRDAALEQELIRRLEACLGPGL